MHRQQFSRSTRYSCIFSSHGLSTCIFQHLVGWFIFCNPCKHWPSTCLCMDSILFFFGVLGDRLWLRLRVLHQNAHTDASTGALIRHSAAPTIFGVIRLSDLGLLGFRLQGFFSMQHKRLKFIEEGKSILQAPADQKLTGHNSFCTWAERMPTSLTPAVLHETQP